MGSKYHFMHSIHAPHLVLEVPGSIPGVWPVWHSVRSLHVILGVRVSLLRVLWFPPTVQLFVLFFYFNIILCL